MNPRAFSRFALIALPVHAYVQNWNHNSAPTDVLQRLERRADTCPSENPVSCSAVNSQLPSNFCCGEDTTCISLDESSSAICCPKGSSCENIGTINCDVSLQDASQNTGPIFTTNLDKKLPTCGDKCCPFGYTCGRANDADVCVLDKSKSGAASTTKLTSTTSATVTATSTPTSLASGIDSEDPPPTKEASNFPTGVFFAGFFPGLVVGILATLAWVVLTKRNNKPADNRGLNMSGANGERPFISGPIRDVRHSNERSDFLGRTRTRARSMFSTHRRSRTVDSVDMWAPKIPTPPIHNNVPVNYINDMQDVPVTPARRVARYHSEEDMRVSRGPSTVSGEKPLDLSPVSPESGNNSQRVHENAPPMPIMPLAAVPPLRGMNTRRVSPPYGMPTTHIPTHVRKDSGTAMGTGFGSPFQTPEKKPTIVNHDAPSMHATYHDITTLDSPDDDNNNTQTQFQTLTPARYDPVPRALNNNIPSSSAVALATKNLTAAQKQSQQQKPNLPPRQPRTDQEHKDFDFDEGLDSPRYSYQFQSDNESDLSRARAAGNTAAANPNATFDSLLPVESTQQSRKDKHATNATTFTTMLRNVGFPDPGNQLAVPAVPKVNVEGGVGKKAGGGKKSGGIKGMI